MCMIITQRPIRSCVLVFLACRSRGHEAYCGKYTAGIYMYKFDSNGFDHVLSMHLRIHACDCKSVDTVNL